MCVCGGDLFAFAMGKIFLRIRSKSNPKGENRFDYIWCKTCLQKTKQQQNHNEFRRKPLQYIEQALLKLI